MDSMRFDPSAVDTGALLRTAASFGSPRLARAAAAWVEFAARSAEGTVKI
ncbi:MAG: hypothetical protein ACLQMF_06785 [Rectinemataceae bacterium]